MAGIKHKIDQSANEILLVKGSPHEVSSIQELEAGEQFVETRLAEMQLESDKLDHDVLEDFLRRDREAARCVSCGAEANSGGVECFECAMTRITTRGLGSKIYRKEGKE